MYVCKLLIEILGRLIWSNIFSNIPIHMYTHCLLHLLSTYRFLEDLVIRLELLLQCCFLCWKVLQKLKAQALEALFFELVFFFFLLLFYVVIVVANLKHRKQLQLVVNKFEGKQNGIENN